MTADQIRGVVVNGIIEQRRIIFPGSQHGVQYGGCSKMAQLCWSDMDNGYQQNQYRFSNYSTDLKTVLNINQFQLNNLGVASNVGRVIGQLSSFVFMLLPTWVALTLGVLVGFLGYGTQWLVVSRIIQPLPYSVVIIYRFPSILDLENNIY